MTGSHGSNGAHSGSPTGRSVAELATAQATTGPSRLAIVDGDHTLTYAALEAQANRLAHHLRSRGAGREGVVALVLPRSADLVVAALAVLRAGAAYAPVDPGAPAERIAAMLTDAGPSVVVTRRGLAPRVARGSWPVVTLDGDAAEIAGWPTVPPDAQSAPSDLAYLIYTSGSTGRPKGVEVTHANLLNLVLWHHTAFQVTAGDRAPLMSSPGFDASVWEIWPTLAAAASLVVMPEFLPFPDCSNVPPPPFKIPASASNRANGVAFGGTFDFGSITRLFGR